MPIAITPDQLALQASIRDWAKQAAPVAAVRGGIGFTWEHDAHLYLRRALALRQLLGGSRAWRTRLAALERRGPAGAAEGEASQEFLLTRCLSIAGGTTQILLNQVAERVLGLPR